MTTPQNTINFAPTDLDNKLSPLLSSDLELHVNSNGGWVLKKVEGSLIGKKKFRSHDVIEVEGYLMDFLVLCDGSMPLSSIETKMAEEYGFLFGQAFFDQAKSMAVLNEFISLESDNVVPKTIKITGSKDGFHPIHSTFEIIETCNFTCDHCYYSSSPFKKGIIELEQAIKIMDQLAERGVRIIELTGGECTIHQDFKKILAHASKTFDLVAIISNGSKIGNNEKLADFICAIPNVVVQISIDGMEEWHNRFRKNKNAFKWAVKAIKHLVKNEVAVRMGCTITTGSIDQILPLYKLGKELNVLQVSFAPIGELGRGCNVADPAAGSKKLSHSINEILGPYMDDPILMHDGGTKSGAGTGAHKAPKNCGAGWRSFAIDYNGEVRACNLSRDSKKFGNLIDDKYENIFEQKANYLFNNAMPPGGIECSECQYKFHCQGCFVKGFITSEQHYPECPWRAKWFPDMPLQKEDFTSQLSHKDILSKLPEREYKQEVCSACSSNLGIHKH